VHGPVGPARFAEFACAVEWIDDPDPFGREAHRIVGALLGEHGVVGVGGRERGHDELVRRPVALGAQVLGVGRGREHGRPERDEELAGFGGDRRGVAMVGGGGRHGRGR
jgi:hypothetical protein